MCGRYQIDDEVSVEIRSMIENIEQKTAGVTLKRGEIYPTNLVPVWMPVNGQPEPEAAVWGFPGFSGKGVLINARAETVPDKKTFRACMEQRRCVIPASGFYEWDTGKNKIYFRNPDAEVLYMAGLYQQNGQEVRFVIVTTQANASMLDVHNRMPLLLQKEELKDWILDERRARGMLSQEPYQLEKFCEFEQARLPFL